MQQAAIQVSFSGRGRPRRCARALIEAQILATAKPAGMTGVVASHRSSPPRRAPPHRRSSAPLHSSPAVAKVM